MPRISLLLISFSGRLGYREIQSQAGGFTRPEQRDSRPRAGSSIPSRPPALATALSLMSEWQLLPARMSLSIFLGNCHYSKSAFFEIHKMNECFRMEVFLLGLCNLFNLVTWYSYVIFCFAITPNPHNPTLLSLSQLVPASCILLNANNLFKVSEM